MRNQPTYHFFKNTMYALQGLKDIIKTERSFQIELILVLIFAPIPMWLDIDLSEKLLMISTLMGLLIAESINSAIERVVDLVTKDYHPMAGRAKDVGSTIVFYLLIFLSIVLFSVVWGAILWDHCLV